MNYYKQAVRYCIYLTALTSLYVTAQDLLVESDADKEIINEIKKELDFSSWHKKTKRNEDAIVFSLSMEQLMPKGVQSTCKITDLPVPAYYVTCSKPDKDGKENKIMFIARVFPSVKTAHEMMLRRFINVSAPISYLKQEWAKKKISYGDVSFGFDYWATGNVVFELTDGRENENLWQEVFSNIDNVMNLIPNQINATPDNMIIENKQTRNVISIKINKNIVKGQLVFHCGGYEGEIIGADMLKLSRTADPGITIRVVERKDEYKCYQISF